MTTPTIYELLERQKAEIGRALPVSLDITRIVALADQRKRTEKQHRLQSESLGQIDGEQRRQIGHRRQSTQENLDVRARRTIREVRSQQRLVRVPVFGHRGGEQRQRLALLLLVLFVLASVAHGARRYAQRPA